MCRGFDSLHHHGKLLRNQELFFVERIWKMIYSVYVLRSLKSGKYYVGMAIDVERRLDEHNKGKSKFTSGHVPWELIYQETIGIAIEARKREKYLKSSAGKQFLKKQGIIQD